MKTLTKILTAIDEENTKTQGRAVACILWTLVLLQGTLTITAIMLG